MIDKQRINRALRGSLIGLLAAAGLLALPALAGAAVFEGSQTDPTGDVVSWDINGPGFPRTTGPGTMDLTGASARYDSGAGLLSFTFSGSAFVYSHSGTTFHGWLSSIAHQPAGTSQCGLGGSSDNPALSFTGSSSTGSGGGPGRGGATLSIMNGLDDPAITGTASFPVDWPEFNNVVTFTFLDARLAHHTYLCALGLWAQYGDHGVSNLDNISDFCIVAGCFDPLGSATPPPAGPPTGIAPTGGVTTSASPVPTVVAAQGAGSNARCSVLPGNIKATTARMRLLQQASHKGSASHKRAVTRQVRVLASRRTTQRATYKALCS